jgi:hypothetical protein
MIGFSRCMVVAVISAIGSLSISAAAITVFIAEDGTVAFSNGTPFAGSGYGSTQGTVVLCDGATNTGNPSTATSCAAGVVDSDIVNFGGTNANIIMQSDRSPGDTNVADLVAFTIQFPGNTKFLQEAAENASGISRTDFTPTAGQPGFCGTTCSDTLTFEIVSDEAVPTPEPSTFLMVAAVLLGLLMFWRKTPRKAGL